MKPIYISIVGLFVLAAIALGGTVYLYSQVDVERNARLELEKQTQSLEAIVQEKEKQLEEKNVAVVSLETQVNELKAEIRTKNQELTKNREAIAQWESKNKDLTEKMRLVEKEKAELKAHVQALEQGPVLSASAGGVGVGSALVESVSPNPAGEGNAGGKKISSQGKVILVNREYQFVVVSLGKLDGLKEKDKLEILRDGQVVGKVNVTKLYDSLSSCDILEESKLSFKEGDIVRTLGR